MKKILIASLFATIILLVTISSAVYEKVDVDDEANDNYEIKPLDDYEEIITFIDGTCNNATSKGIYIKRDVTFQGGENTGL